MVTDHCDLAFLYVTIHKGDLVEEQKVLVVEDDRDLAHIIRDYLNRENYAVRCADDGASALILSEQFHPDLIVLDIMLPKVDGIEVCRRVRQTSFAPILVISAKNSDVDKLVSLGVGADDYLTKPFSMVELVARVKSHLRRYTTFSQKPASGSKIVCGALTLDTTAFQATVDGRPLPLTAKEFHLLAHFVGHPMQVFSRAQLSEAVWDTADYIDDNTVAVTVGRLREKLAKEQVQFIRTVWGVGYKWEP